jgi:hypothetical protein
MRSFTLLFLLCAAYQVSLAQQSMFETGDGRTSLYLRQPAASVNFGDSKASASIVHDVGSDPVYYGASAYATANTGIASLFSSDKPTAPEGGVDGVVGRIWDPAPKCDNCAYYPRDRKLLLDVGYGRSSFYLFPTGSTPSASVAKTYFDRFRTVVAANFFLFGNVYIGLAGGAERRNNLSDLQAATAQTTLAAAPSGGATSIVKTKTGYYGNYQEYIAAPIYQDALFFLGDFSHLGIDNRIGLDLMTRSDVGPANRSASGGIGLFLLNKDDPYKVVGGLTATYDGIKLQLSLTTGYTGAAPK